MFVLVLFEVPNDWQGKCTVFQYEGVRHEEPSIVDYPHQRGQTAPIFLPSS